MMPSEYQNCNTNQNQRLMNNIVLSIIVTGYNIEQFISEALDSVLKQKFSVEFEVIAVDDCSSDDTYNIMCKYQQKFKDADVAYTVVKSPVNGGVAYARARGLDVANGRYTLFLDGDDYFLGEDLLNTVVTTAIDEDLDCIIFNYTSDRYQKYLKYDEGTVLSGREAVKGYFNKMYDAMVWMKLWRTDILKSHPYDYLRYYEDMICTPIWVALSKKIKCMPQICGYYYRTNPDSVCHKVRILEYIIKSNMYLKHFFKNSPDILKEIDKKWQTSTNV